MTVAQMSIFLLLLFFSLIFMSFPIAISLGMTTMIVMFVNGLPLSMYSTIMFSGVSKFVLLAIPFFILAGYVMEVAGISRRLVHFIEILVGDLPGGLGIASVITCLFWGAISGSGPATVAALGVILIPGMKNAGYDLRFACALVAAASGVAVVIPPSIGFVVYGSIANISIGKIFIAGIIPGLVIGLGYGIYTFWVARKRGWRGAKRGTRREVWLAFKDAFWGMMTPVIILGGIYGGIFTPTEAAAVAVAYGLIVGLFIYKEIRIGDLLRIVGKAGVSSAGVLFIIANASVLTWLITTQQIATFFTNLLLGVSGNAITAMLLMGLVVFIAGFFIDGTSIFYLFLPVFLPVLRAFDMDLVWFGVFMQTAIAIGFITPPVAVNLYPACLIGGISLEEITKPIVGFVAAAIITLLIIGFFPILATWLPSMLGM